jgi:hypothetical protein
MNPILLVDMMTLCTLLKLPRMNTCYGTGMKVFIRAKYGDWLHQELLG